MIFLKCIKSIKYKFHKSNYFAYVLLHKESPGPALYLETEMC